VISGGAWRRWIRLLDRRQQHMFIHFFQANRADEPKGGAAKSQHFSART